MLRTNRKLLLRLAALCLLLAGFFIAQRTPVSARTDCPVCPIPYHCNPWDPSGDCVCDCPNPDGTCPAGCA
jgi:hypothetical protein